MLYWLNKHISLSIFILSVIGFATFSLILGQDANWDIRNYHYYNAYALFNNRLAYDIAPAQLQTFFNPALDLLPYLLIQNFPPFIFSLAMGAWHGLNAWLLFLIGRELLVRLSFPNPIIWAVVCAIVGVTGGVTLSEVGTTLHDLTLSVFILGSVYLYLRACSCQNPIIQDPSLKYLSASGFLLGLSAGLKLSFAIYVVGMGMAVFVVQFAILRQYKAFLVFVLSTTIALLCAAGPWMWVLWKQYGNPFFPMYNALFLSPYYLPENFVDARFFPKSLADALFFPLNFNMEKHAGCEIQFRDFRIATLYIASVLGVAYALVSTILQRCVAPEAYGKKNDFLVLWMSVFIWMSYIVWLKMFSIYRYLICIELLVPIALACIASAFKNHPKIMQSVLATIFLLIVIFTKPPEWGRFHAENNGFFGVRIPAINWSRNAVVLMPLDSPQSFVVPSFPDFVRFVRVGGNFIHPTDNTALTERIRSVMAESVDNLYLMTDPPAIGEGLVLVNKYLKHHEVKINQCWPVTNKFDPISLCSLTALKKGEPAK